MLHNTDEAKRIEALHKLKILDTNAEQDFDDIVTLAAKICNTPISIISFVDINRQWYKAKIGVDYSETPRNISICSQAIAHDILIIPDLLKDERFVNNPFVTNTPLLRFYGGITLKTEDGFALGALCVMDTIPKVLDEGQIWALRVLARQVIKHIHLRSQVLDSESKLTAYFNSTTEEVFLVDPRNNVLAFNREAERNSELMFGLQVKIGSSMLLYVEPHLHKK